MTVYASIDLGGTNIAGLLATAEGEVLLEQSTPTESHLGPAAVVERMGYLLERMAAEAGRRPEGIGIGVPGLIDYDSGSALFLPNFPTQWRGVPVRAPLEARLGCRVSLLNDARLAALGESVYGRGRDVESLVFYTLGTGIGGGMAFGGKLRLGTLGAAGEIGHHLMVPEGPICGCGSRGCLEAVASGPAISGEGVRIMRAGNAPILHALAKGDANAVTPKLLAEAADAGDRHAAAVIERAARYLGIGIANVVTTLQPELVVLGGGVAAMGERLLAPVREEVRARVRMFPTDGVRIEISALGAMAGALGGIALAAGRGLEAEEEKR